MQGKAIGYVRVSTEEQAEEGVSLAAQRDRIIAYCEAHGLELLDILADEGISGKAFDNRPGAREAIEVAKRECCALIVVKLDRLSRSVIDTLQLIERAGEECWQLHSIEEHLDTETAAGRATVAIIAAIAQMTREQIGENTKRSLEQRRREGVYLGRAPYGWRAVTGPGGVRTLEEDAGQQEGLARMLELARGGMSFAAIARTLNGEELKTAEGCEWSGKQVSRIVKRELAAESVA